MNTNSTSLTSKISVPLRFIRQKALANPLWQYRTSIGLKRKLSIPFPPPQAAIPLALRELKHSDIPLILSSDFSMHSRQERREIEARRKLIDQNIARCFVAIDQATGYPCFIQWLFTAEQNDFIETFFRGRFPRLSPDQGLLECAYTPRNYRGKGIMPATMALIAELAPSFGLSELITFVDHNNLPSLKGCAKAGFIPFLTRKDVTIFSAFKRRRFVPLPPPPHVPSRSSTLATSKERSL